MPSRSQLKIWFQTGKKPTQEQYQSWIDGYFNLQEDTLPMSQVDGLTTALNQIYLNQQNNTSVVSNAETYLATTGDFAKAFTAGKVLESILIDPLGSGSILVQIGTTAGGSEVVQDLPIDVANPEPFQRKKYFKTAATWYFTGIPAGTTVKFFYS